MAAMTGLLQRCANREPCCEVRDRLLAADRSRAEGFDEVADQLRATAARWAEAHHFGSPAELEEVS